MFNNMEACPLGVQRVTEAWMRGLLRCIKVILVMSVLVDDELKVLMVTAF